MIDGFTLDSGDVVHFPPHAAAQVRPMLKRGQEVKVVGTRVPGPSGEVLEASAIKNLTSGKSVELAAVAHPLRDSVRLKL